MTIETTRKFDLEERTFLFAREIRRLLKQIPKNTIRNDDRDQLVRSSGSVAANYIEANESISSKDFSMRIKICRKEARESQLWLKLMLEEINPEYHAETRRLTQEALELAKIFGAILRKINEN